MGWRGDRRNGQPLPGDGPPGGDEGSMQRSSWKRQPFVQRLPEVEDACYASISRKNLRDGLPASAPPRTMHARWFAQIRQPLSVRPLMKWVTQICMIQFFFRQRFDIFATNVVLSPDPFVFLASLNILFSDRAGASRHLDFDEQTHSTEPRFSPVITHGTNFGLIVQLPG